MNAPAHPGAATAVPHIIKGRTVLGADVEHGGFTTPALDIDALVWPRREPGPAFDTPVADVIDFLVEVGTRLQFDSNPYLQEALEHSLAFNTLERRILENTYRAMPLFFDRTNLEFQVAADVGWGPIDGWAPIERPHGLPAAHVRAFPPRLAHITAGNTPAVAVTTIVRGALSKGVHLLKVPANDLFTAGAVLRTMADVDPDHPTTRSFSAVYWRGGETTVESAIFRPQFFDKLVVWVRTRPFAVPIVTPGPGSRSCRSIRRCRCHSSDAKPTSPTNPARPRPLLRRPTCRCSIRMPARQVVSST
ncbi:putative acyl-CoA reductase [Gordonia aichiensis NBRC 108223]|uniref:Putative acyl-CoA reductase n=1 Tax=Gordonia aichiensis NBRC 108223 TaxID=1220583 RepID=L7KJM3_9ACTN|nr:putative acyl-CoA reductase [Gordonia aichiensis NBRC 108223]